MSELHLIENPITKADLKKIAEERFGDLRERELLSWVKFHFRQYTTKNISKEELRESLVLGIDDVLNR